MKGLFKRRQTWWIRFTPGPGMPQERQSLETHDEAEAIIQARKIIDRAKREAKTKAESCSSEVDRYLEHIHHKGLAASTRDSRSYVLRAFIAHMGVSTPRSISQAAIERWFSERRQEHVHTAEAYLTIVQYWFTWLVETRRLTSDPSSGILKPQLPMRHRKVFLRPDQARQLLEACGTNYKLKFAIYCGLHAGLRKREIIEARPEWFDLHQGLLHVQATPTFEPKDKDNRTIPLTDEFCTWLKRKYGLKKPYMLAPKAAHGDYRYRYDFRTAYENLVQQCGLQVTFHDLRRTFASLHVSAGTSIYKVAKWLGDDVEIVQSTYGHLLPQDAEINSIWSSPAQAPPTPKTPPP